MKSQAFKWSYYFILSLSIVLIFTTYLVYKNSLITLGAWNATNRLQIFLKIDITVEDKEKLITAIQSLPNVSKVYENDRLKAADSFKNSLKSYANQLLTDDELLDLLPESLEIELNPSLSPEERQNAYALINTQFTNNSSVDEIIDNTAWLKKFEGLDRFIRQIGLFAFTIILVFISYFVSLMLKVYVDESRSELEVYTLLGATSWSLYSLLTKELIKWLTLSLFLSVSISFIMFKIFITYAKGQDLSVALLNQLQFVSAKEILFISFFIAVFTLVKSLLTLQESLQQFRQLSND